MIVEYRNEMLTHQQKLAQAWSDLSLPRLREMRDALINSTTVDGKARYHALCQEVARQESRRP